MSTEKSVFQFHAEHQKWNIYMNNGHAEASDEKENSCWTLLYFFLYSFFSLFTDFYLRILIVKSCN